MRFRLHLQSLRPFSEPAESRCSVTNQEFEAALVAGRKAAESRFNNQNLRQWLDDALDAACDAVLAASKRYESKIGPFAPFARSWVDRALRSLLAKRSKRSTKRPNQLQLSLEFSRDGKSITISGIPDDLINRLTEFQREVISRRYIQSETYAEIGQARGVSRQAAHQVHARAIKQIRKKIDKGTG